MTNSRFAEAIEAAVRNADVPGITAARVDGDSTTVQAAGWADRERGIPMSPSHRMLAGSVGKTFTAATAAALQAAGVLRLDDRVARWLGEARWYPRLANADAITLRQLLSHQAGLPDHRESPAFARALRGALGAAPPQRDVHLSPETLVGFVLDEAALFEPGAGYRYSETGYILAGMVLERASGRPVYDLAREFFLDPLGLGDTEPANRRSLGGLAQGYVGANDLGIPERMLDGGALVVNPATEWTGGGFVSTARDLAHWVRRLYRGEALPGESYLDDMLAGRVFERSSTGPVAYGLGTYVRAGDHGPYFGHGGEAPGYRSAAYYFPDHDMAVALQVNSSIVPAAAVQGLLERLADALFRA